MEYRQAVSLKERIAMLEKILVGNILSFAKGVRIFFDTQVECEIMQLEQLEHVTYKGVKLIPRGESLPQRVMTLHIEWWQN